MDFFEKVDLWKPLEAFGVVLTHFPIEEKLFRHGCTHNVHGH